MALPELTAIDLTSVTPPPPDSTTQQAVASGVEATTVAVAPASDGTTQPAAAAAPVAETAPVQAEQLKWPDTIELDETTKGVAQTGNTNVIETYKTAEKTVFACLKKNDDIIKKNKELRDKFEALDNIIDPFIEETQTSIGKLKEIFNPSTK